MAKYKPIPNTPTPTIKRIYVSPPFTTLTPITVPAEVGTNPTVLSSTTTSQTFRGPGTSGGKGKGANHQGRITATSIDDDAWATEGDVDSAFSGQARASGIIQIIDDNFSTGAVEIRLGGISFLLGHIQSLPGDFGNDTDAGEDAPALIGVGGVGEALVTAISNLPGWDAWQVDSIVDGVAAVGLVSVNVLTPSGLIGRYLRFEVFHHGTIENITLSPTTGLFAANAPVISAPDRG